MEIPVDDPVLLRDALARELATAHAAEIGLSDRLAAEVGATIRVRMRPCPQVEGVLVRVGVDHLWLADQHGSWLIATAAVDGVLLPGPFAVARHDPRGLASALRELVSSAEEVSLLLGDHWAEGAIGTIGADFVELGRLTVPVSRIRACRVWY
ncbi:MAG: hypothetical protein ACTHOG_13200 [Marmoricola sp.]